MQRTHYWWLGALAGLGFGVSDWAIFRFLNIEMMVRDHDVTLYVMAFMGTTYALFGAVIGLLFAARGRIREQLTELRAAQTRAVELESLAAIGRLAAGVAHEVRNPLAVIRSSTELLVESVEDADARRAGQFIVEEVDRLDGFIGSLLDFARPVSTERRSHIGIHEVLDALARLVGSDVEFRRGPQASFEADPDQVVQLIHTLVVNALDAGSRCVVESRSSGAEVIFEVRDDGAGVSSEHQPLLFQPFFTTKARGTGLGLAMARRMVTAHGGDIRYVAGGGLGPAGAGACFRVTLLMPMPMPGDAS